jgi:hypothetical protein
LIAIQGVEDMRFISPFALLLVAFCSAAPNCTASEQSESITPGFRFEEIDVVCVMPVVDKVQSPSSPIDTNSLRPLVILELERRGFPVEDPSCSNEAKVERSPATTSRWLFKVTIDNLQLMGSTGSDGIFRGTVFSCVVTASVFDTRINREVWSSRAASTTVLDHTLRGMFDNVLRRIMKPVEMKAKVTQPLTSTKWLPRSVEANIFTVKHGMRCPGNLQATSENLSFTLKTDDPKCKEYEFSVPRSEVKSYALTYKGSGYPTAFNVALPGKKTVQFCNANEIQVDYLFAALGSGL